MRITVLQVGQPELKTSANKTKYEEFALSYNDGKQTKERKLRSFEKEVYGILKAAGSGEQFEITLKKNGEFWNWVSAEPVASDAAPKAGGGASKGNWETSEERAARQLYIIRQSSIANAIAFLKSDADADITNVLNVAQSFVDFCMKGLEDSDPDVS